jgi:hypothetical protein
MLYGVVKRKENHLPTSPCFMCGELCLHTEDDELPRCDACGEAWAAKELIDDIIHGRITIPDVLEEKPLDE